VLGFWVSFPNKKLTNLITNTPIQAESKIMLKIFFAVCVFLSVWWMASMFEVCRYTLFPVNGYPITVAFCGALITMVVFLRSMQKAKGRR